MKYGKVSGTRHAVLVFIGFTLILVILSFATSIGLRNMDSANQRLEHLVKDHNVKSLLMTKMRDVIRERMLIVFTIINEDDPFEVESQWEQFSAYAGTFIQARKQLYALDTTRKQRRQIEAQRPILAKGQRILDKVVDLVRESQTAEAGRMIMKAREINKKILDDLSAMRDMQQEVSQQSVREASLAFAETRQRIYMLDALAVVFCIAIILFIVSYIRRQEKALASAVTALREANETLESRVTKRTDELMKARTENLRLNTELDVARRLQQMILPKEQELVQIQGLDIAAFIEPTAEIGGDYYDLLQHAGHVKICIGDVTGHGLESGVLMLMVQTAVRTLLAGNITDLSTSLNALNCAIYANVQRMDSDKNLSLCLLDYQDGKLRLVGQHEEILVVRKDGNVERIDTVDLGFPIGLTEEISDFVAQKEVRLQTGDGVVLFTDGITEAENPQQEHYGIERLCEAVRCNWELPSEEIQRAIIADLHKHISTQKIYDDITLLVIKQKAAASPNKSGITKK
ncbi:MAG: SpoIIE family protein phosphatase [Gammaproteobacteria bacterium]|nr:SpoIIE family protein phosphatase [Gammaproteobacteria bacterium]